MGKDKSKKHKKDKKKKRRSSSSSEEWVEKPNNSSEEEEGKAKRDEWMSLGTSFQTESHLDRRQQREEAKRSEKESEKYNPGKSGRELNPYWKDGGDGLPTFKKPNENEEKQTKYESGNRYKATSGWRKNTVEETPKIEEKNENACLTDNDLNVLASKLVKAEIMGNVELAEKLKKQLDAARQSRGEAEAVILTETDSRGQSRPVRRESDKWGGRSKKRKVETHKDGERVRYFPDDDKRSLKEMFENEKFNTVHRQNSEFMKLAGKISKNDDLEDVFTDKITRGDKDVSRERAISQHETISKSLDNCKFCIQSEFNLKHLMISMSECAYLSLPAFEPLTRGHCLISPIRHVTSSTLLDENEWSDILNYRRSLTNYFKTKNKGVIFFETARNFDRHKHMFIECVPIDNEECDLAPIYFKKAIDECEEEWAQNKKLVSLKGRDVRRAIPKGLPYFFVSFDMEEGYAHVLEDERHFPLNFAQEIIGGMLDLHHSKWRKPKMEAREEQVKRVEEFSRFFCEFDFTK